MTQTEIKAVEVVRQIRDQHYALLKDKSREDIKHFFPREAAAANAEAKQLLQKAQSTIAPHLTLMRSYVGARTRTGRCCEAPSTFSQQKEPDAGNNSNDPR